MRAGQIKLLEAYIESAELDREVVWALDHLIAGEAGGMSDAEFMRLCNTLSKARTKEDAEFKVGGIIKR